MRIVEQDVDVAVLVRDVCGDFDSRGTERSTNPTVVVPEGMPTLRTDPIRLKQILVNPVSNAIKFSPHGVVTVTVHSEHAGGSGGRSEYQLGLRRRGALTAWRSDDALDARCAPASGMADTTEWCDPACRS